MALSTLKKPDMRLNLYKIGASYRNAICNQLDHSGGWHRILCLLPTGSLDDHEIHKVKNAQSPTETLIFHILANERGWLVRHLVKFLELIQNEILLAEFKEYEPPVVLLQPPRYIVVKSGSVVVFETFASGFPHARYNWFYQDIATSAYKQLNFNGPKFIINYPTPENTGVYFCRIHNLNVDTVVWTDDCFVKVLPQQKLLPIQVSSAEKFENVKLSHSESFEEEKNTLPVVIVHPNSLQVDIGEQAILSFVVDKADRYTWYKNCQELHGVDTSNFEISCIEPEDEGVYYCIASNRFGTVKSKQVTLDIKPSVNLSLDKPHILCGPVEESGHVGDVAVFNIVAQGLKPLTYNWFKDEQFIERSKNSELRVNINSKSCCGKYSCTVMDRNGSQALSPSVELRVYSEQKRPYTATDKIFIAVGCSTYTCARPLSAPKFDICVLKKKFEAMDFKTIVLHDLDLKACLNLVHKVRTLIHKGIYVVAYFGGHGFERDGQLYFMPVDHPACYQVSDCLCIEYVLQIWQQKNPALMVVFADMCRDENPNQDRSEMEKYNIPVHGNQIILYATSKHQMAYEDKRSSFFASLLELELSANKPVINFCNEMICKMPAHKENYHQEMYPNLLSNLAELRSLHDPIENGTGKIHHLHQKIRNEPTSKVLSIECSKNNIQCQVKITWDVICDNVLCVKAEVTKFNLNNEEKSAIACVVRTDGCLVASSRPWRSNNDIKVKDVPEVDNTYEDAQDCRKTSTYLTELEKLQGSLSLKLIIRYIDDDGNTKSFQTGREPVIEYQDILIMPWNLWHDVPLPGRHNRGEPQESLEPLCNSYGHLPVADTVGLPMNSM